MTLTDAKNNIDALNTDDDNRNYFMQVVDAMEEHGKAFINVQSYWMFEDQKTPLCQICLYSDGTYEFTSTPDLTGPMITDDVVSRVNEHMTAIESALS